MRAFWLVAAIAWFLCLAVWASLPGGESGVWALLAEARFSGISLALLGEALWILAVDTLPFVVLGALCRLTFPGGGSNGARIGRMLAFPVGLAWSWGLGLLVAGLGVGANWRAPAAVEAFLPLLGCFVGAILAGAFFLPLRSVVRSLLARALAIGVVGVLTCVTLAAAVLGEGRSTAPQAAITSDDKRALVDEIRARNPLRLAPGERTVLELAPDQLESLLAWGVLLVDDSGRAAVRRAGEGIAWEASMGFPIVPGLRRQLVLTGELALAAKDGTLTVARCEFAAGALALPPWLCRSLLGSLYRAAISSRDFGALAVALDWLTVDESGLSARYTRPELNEGVLRRLRFALGPGRAVRAAATAQFDLLRARSPDLAQSEDRFREIVQGAFELAERRSVGGDPVAENQGAILALATILGHPEVATLAGLERPPDWRRIRDAFWPVRLRGRGDWSRHFMVSAGLTQVSAAAVSDAAGLLKEELDAVRGSGFSFGDLLADRAGTRFGEVAVRNPATARAVQTALARNWRVDHLMPPADGLPEALDDAELTQRFGGVGGPGYQALVAEIEARIGRLPDFSGAGAD